MVAAYKRTTARWAFENEKGVTCYVYGPNFPKHMLSTSKNVRRCGYYDYTTNLIMSDEVVTIQDGRIAPGS